MRIIANHDGNPPISASSRQNTFSPSIFFETTYNILPQTEIGLGLGYIKRKGFEHSASWGIHGGGEYAPISDNTGIETYKIPRYASLPIYFILKQDYALSRNTNLYFKANLGYSINKISNTQYKYYTDLEQENVFKLSEFQSGLRPMKVKNGLYLGLGLGIEYKAFLAEIGYYHTKSKVTRKNYNYEIRNSIYESTSYNNDAIRLTLGVKF